MKQDKQQQLTKFYPLQLTSKKNNRSIEPMTPPTPIMKQPSITTFFHPSKTTEKRSRLDTSRRNDKSTNTKNSTIVINNSSPTIHVSPRKNQTQPHLNYLYSYRQQACNTIHQIAVNPTPFKLHHVILNPYLPNHAGQHQNRISKLPPNQPTIITPPRIADHVN